MYDNPSYVGRAVLGSTEAVEANKEEAESQLQAAGEVRVVWEEDQTEAEWAQQWQHWPPERRPVNETGEEAHVTEADADSRRTEWIADTDDYQASVSQYPHGYGRFAEQSTAADVTQSRLGRTRRSNGSTRTTTRKRRTSTWTTTG